MRQAIIIGASSGIGEALARVLAAEGYSLGLVARREERLRELQEELPTPSYVKRIDVSRPEEAMPLLRELIAEMGDVELYVVNAGVGERNSRLEWAPEDEVIRVNVHGFAAMVNVAFHALRERGSGHLVGISSISALRGFRQAPAYSASKAFVSHYLEAVRHHCRKRRLPITVTDVKPGFVDTAMAQGPDTFWMAPVEKAARQIYGAIRSRKAHVYVTRRWRLVAWALKAMPRWLHERT